MPFFVLENFQQPRKKILYYSLLAGDNTFYQRNSNTLVELQSK